MAQLAPGATLAPTRTGAAAGAGALGAGGATGAVMLVADGAAVLGTVGAGSGAGVGCGVGGLGGGGVFTTGVGGGASAINKASTVFCVAWTTSRARPDSSIHSSKACRPSTRAMLTRRRWGWRWRCA